MGQRLRAVGAFGALVVLGVGGLGLPDAGAASKNVSVSVSGANGSGRIERPGRRCTPNPDQPNESIGAADGAYWHYEYESRLPGGTFSGLQTELGMHLDAHSDLDHVSYGSGPSGWLAGSESYVTLANQRGTLKLRLADGGSCTHPTATLDPSHIATSGTWTILSDGGAGAYKGASGTGTFSLDAGIAPGADNPWHLDLNGPITVLSPAIAADTVSTSWGNLGVDYVTRIVTVDLRITNTGPGETFGAKLTGASSPTSGVTLLTPMPRDLGDLHVNESKVVSLRYKLGLLSPCALVVLGCDFDINAVASLPDGLDVVVTSSDPAHAKAPTLPPPL